MFFIERGEVDIYNKDTLKTETQYGKKIRTLYPSDFFGEIGAMFRGFRSASVVSANYCNLGKLSSATLKELSQRYPEIQTMFHYQVNVYDDNMTLFLKEALL